MKIARFTSLRVGYDKKPAVRILIRPGGVFELEVFGDGNDPVVGMEFMSLEHLEAIAEAVYHFRMDRDADPMQADAQKSAPTV